MNIFVSGATGFIGSRLCLRLAEEGHIVNALYRSLEKTKIINHPGIRLFKGDILDKKSLGRALEGCEAVYHAAAFTSVWQKDPGRIYRLNIEGTLNVIEGATHAGVKKIVVTSTAGVMGSSGQRPVDENSVPPSFFLDYETSKFILEKILVTFSSAGPEIVIVNPTRVYGPGPLTESNGVTRMVERYCRGRWHFIPGNGKSIGNYAFVDDVVTGHLLAMEKGRSGERYILGGENASYRQFFATLAAVSGKKYILFGIPLFILTALAGVMLFFARLTGKSPMLTPALARKFSRDYRVSSGKAEQILGYKPSGLASGLEKTVAWLREKQIRT